MRPEPDCIALIADLVRSRRYAAATRRDIQERLAETLQRLNHAYKPAILSQFLITTGDEFQGLLKDGSVIPDIIWELENDLGAVSFRLGVGCGRLDTELRDSAIGMDGPVWHRAREGVHSARILRRFGGVFVGFGELEDPVLNGLSRLLRHIRERFTTKQRDIANLLRSDSRQTEIAHQLHVSRQVISKQVKTTGWDAYEEGEAAWRLMLQRFNYAEHWS